MYRRYFFTYTTADSFAGLAMVYPFFSPDIAMLGYLINTSIGAYCYNLFHHKAVAIVLACIGFYTHNEWLTLVGILLFAHASFDRVFGYGLKYTDSFKNTHLGKLK